MEKNKYSKNLNKYEQLYFLIEDYAKEYSKFLEDKDNRTNENRCERYYKKVYDFVKQELDKARKEGYEKAIKDMMLFSFGWEYDLKTQQYLGKIPFSEEAVNLCTEKGTAERLSILSAKRKELSKLKDNRVYGEERI